MEKTEMEKTEMEKPNCIDNLRQITKTYNQLLELSKKLHPLLTTYSQEIIPCCHRFVKDTVDTGPESTMEITYCEICEYTKS